jgi:hypothetical protein
LVGCIDWLMDLPPALEVRFGEEGLKLLPEIRKLQDVDMLRAILQASKTAASPDEVRRVWVPPRLPSPACVAAHCPCPQRWHCR